MCLTGIGSTKEYFSFVELFYVSLIQRPKTTGGYDSRKSRIGRERPCLKEGLISPREICERLLP